MDKKTLIAVAISALILFGWYEIQSRVRSGQEASLASSSIDGESLSPGSELVEPAITAIGPDLTQVSEPGTSSGVSTDDPQDQKSQGVEVEQLISVDTDVFSIIFTSKNATIDSLYLTDQAQGVEQITDNDNSLQLVPESDHEQMFRVLLGDTEDVAQAQDVYYRVSRPLIECSGVL